jgi:7-keto-8-aminopelargonate synthetase-like enzyme
MPPSVLGALNASLNLHLTDEIIQYQDELLEKIIYFKTVCEQLSIPLPKKENTPIFMIKIGEDKHILEKQNKLTEKGFFTSTAIFPAINKGEGGVRLSITRHITKEDIECLLENISKLLQPKPLPEVVTQ